MSDIQRKVVNSVFGWMIGGLSISTAVAYLITLMPISTTAFMGLFIISAIASLIVVWLLGKNLHEYSYESCKWLFIGFTALEGMMLSSVFIAYTLPSIVLSLAVTVGLFAIMYLIGKITKIDLLGFSSFFLYALIGLIIASVVNIFVASTWLYWLVTYAGIVIFLGLTAYDAQKLKRDIRYVTEFNDDAKKIALDNALALYLDFINLLLLILRILGQRK